MIITKYEVKYTNQFKKQLKRAVKQGKDIDKLFMIVEKLANLETLDSRYRNHMLVNSKYYKECYECHIEPDWLLVY